MAFCTQCGYQLGGQDFYCGSCGSRQGTGAAPGVWSRAGTAGISPRRAAMLCYVPFVGWIASIFVLASQRFRDMRDIRFHAFQGLYLFVAWLLVDWFVQPSLRFAGGFLYPVSRLLKWFVIAVWVFMLVKASREQRYSLPVIGGLAEKSL